MGCPMDWLRGTRWVMQKVRRWGTHSDYAMVSVMVMHLGLPMG